MGFYGDCSHYIEIPKPDEIYDYEKYKDPYWILDKEDNINKSDDNLIDQTSKFVL